MWKMVVVTSVNIGSRDVFGQSEWNNDQTSSVQGVCRYISDLGNCRTPNRRPKHYRAPAQQYNNEDPPLAPPAGSNLLPSTANSFLRTIRNSSL